jgi:transglutaminase-like putative cysteine protease
MWLHASCFLEFNIPVPTPFVLMLRPRSGRQQWVACEQYVLSPSVSAVEFTDLFGNLCQRLVAPTGHFTIHTSVDIETSDAYDTAPGAPFVEVQQLPDETLPFLLPSRYCESDRFTEMAASIVQGRAAGYDQCKAIVDYIRSTIRYTPGAGQQIISASELNESGSGVCRDLAHLGIACCRALSIPARMVVGYLETLEPMDLHAWFEAFVGNQWYTFDPTQVGLVGGRIAIAFGRDAADVAIYTQFGDPVSLLNMQVNVGRLTEPPFSGKM